MKKLFPLRLHATSVNAPPSLLQTCSPLLPTHSLSQPTVPLPAAQTPKTILHSSLSHETHKHIPIYPLKSKAKWEGHQFPEAGLQLYSWQPWSPLPLSTQVGLQPLARSVVLGRWPRCESQPCFSEELGVPPWRGSDGRHGTALGKAHYVE